MQNERIRVAAIQASPVFLDREGTVEKACGLIRTAGRGGATLAAFGEGFLPGYPIHAGHSAQDPLWWELAAEYLNQAVEIPGPETDALCQAAFEADIDVVIGVSERDPITRGSIYSTQLLIGREGRIVSRHRKLKPALYERLVWADGDALGLNVADRGYAIVSGLSGWEHQMALPTYALAEQGAQIHVAGWPGGEPPAPRPPIAMWPRQLLLSRAFAAQAGAYVICAAGTMAAADVPEKYRAYVADGLGGHSAIIDPRGEIVAGPLEGEDILYADCDMALLRAAKVAFDCTGHSARSDQLRFWNQAMGAQDGLQDGTGSGSPGQMGDHDMDGDDMSGDQMDGDMDDGEQPDAAPSRQR